MNYSGFGKGMFFDRLNEDWGSHRNKPNSSCRVINELINIEISNREK